MQYMFNRIKDNNLNSLLKKRKQKTKKAKELMDNFNLTVFFPSKWMLTVLPEPETCRINPTLLVLSSHSICLINLSKHPEQKKQPPSPSFFSKILNENRAADCLLISKSGSKKPSLLCEKIGTTRELTVLHRRQSSFHLLLPLIIDGGRLSRCRPDLYRRRMCSKASSVWLMSAFSSPENT